MHFHNNVVVLAILQQGEHLYRFCVFLCVLCRYFALLCVILYLLWTFCVVCVVSKLYCVCAFCAVLFPAVLFRLCILMLFFVLCLIVCHHVVSSSLGPRGWWTWWWNAWIVSICTPAPRTSLSPSEGAGEQGRAGRASSILSINYWVSEQQ